MTSKHLQMNRQATNSPKRNGMFLRQNFNNAQRAKENPVSTEAVRFHSWQTFFFTLLQLSIHLNARKFDCLDLLNIPRGWNNFRFRSKTSDRRVSYSVFTLVYTLFLFFLFN